VIIAGHRVPYTATVFDRGGEEALLLVALSALILLLEVARHHAPTETALLLALLAAIALAGRWLLRDLRVHPANFPYPSGSHGLRLTIDVSDAERQPR
jgi:hypothetical protein